MSLFPGSRNPTMITKKSICIAWPWKSRSNTLFHDLSYLRLQTWYEFDLGVDSNIFEVDDIKNVENNTWSWRLTLELKVTQIHCMTLLAPAKYMLQTWSWCRYQHLQCREKTQNQLLHLDGWPWKWKSNTFVSLVVNIIQSWSLYRNLQIIFICCFKYLECIAKSSVFHSNSSCF